MSETFKIKGRLIAKEATVQVTETFKKREFVIEVVNERNEQYNDLIKFQLSQNNCDKIAGFGQNAEIEVSFNIRGRKFEKDGKVSYFTTLEAWKIDGVGATQPAATTAPAKQPAPAPAPTEESDDLPF